MSTLTTGLGAYGKFRTYSGTVVAVIVSIIACVIGGYLIKNPDKHTATAIATVKDSTQGKDPNGNPMYSVVAEYNVGGTNYSASGPTDRFYNKGQTMNIYYDPKNPGDYTIKPLPSWLGWAVIGFATFVAVASIGFAYFFSTLSNQGKATVGGIQAAGNALSFLRSD